MGEVVKEEEEEKEGEEEGRGGKLVRYLIRAARPNNS